MKRIITGGTGLIGTALAESSLAQGIDVTVIGRSREKINKRFGSRVTAVSWDEFSANSLLHLEDCQAIFNLAGANISDKRWSDKRKQELMLSRIKSTDIIASACAELGANSPPLFNASAISYYGFQDSVVKSLPNAISEDTELKPEQQDYFSTQLCRCWEAATSVAKQAGTRVILLRFGIVLARQGGALPPLAWQHYFGLGGKIDTGWQPFSWITLADVIASIEFMLTQGEISGAINMVAPGCVPQAIFSLALAKIFRRPARLKLPVGIYRLLLGEMAEELILRGQHVIPKRLTDLNYAFLHPSLDKALPALYNRKWRY